MSNRLLIEPDIGAVMADALLKGTVQPMVDICGKYCRIKIPENHFWKVLSVYSCYSSEQYLFHRLVKLNIWEYFSLLGIVKLTKPTQ